MQTRINPEVSLVACQLMLAWLSGSQARDTIRALPKAETRAIVQQIRAVDAHYREVRGRMSDLAQALDALLALLQEHLRGVSTPLDALVTEADNEEHRDADEDIDESPLDDLPVYLFTADHREDLLREMQKRGIDPRCLDR
jgi:hypothetical protein